jgi:hypothetical protein
MKKIGKYELNVIGRQEIDMPAGAQILSVQLQCRTPHLWVLVDPDEEEETRIINTYGTGIPIEGVCGSFIGTYQLYEGLVFHVFAV